MCGVGEHGGLPLQARTVRAPPSHWATSNSAVPTRTGQVDGVGSGMCCPQAAGAHLRPHSEQPGAEAGGPSQAWSPRVAQAHLSGRRSLSLPAGPVACGVESQERRRAQEKAVREQLAATVREALQLSTRQGSPPHPPPFMRHPHPSPVLRGVSHLSGGLTGNSDLLKIFSPSSFIDPWELPAGKGQGRGLDWG